VWQAGAASSYATPVSGLGDAPYKGWPSSGALNIKIKGLTVVVAEIEFSKTPETIDMDDAALAKLVLPRL
jgi:hypothetical protein